MVSLIDGNAVILLGLVSYLLVRGVLLIWRYKKGRLIYWIKESIQVLFVLYICMLISVTLFPVFLQDMKYEYNLAFSTNIIPFASIVNDISQIGTAYDGDVLFMVKLLARNVGGNILLFFPLGFILPLLFHRFRSVNQTLFLGFVSSLSIEILQFLETISGIYVRTTDIDDVICNVIGVITGFGLYKLYCKFSYPLHLKVLQKWMS